MRKYIELGQFAMTQPKMRVSDPYYSKGAPDVGIISPCLIGLWDAVVVQCDTDFFGVRNVMLVAKHSSVKNWTFLNRPFADDDELKFHHTWIPLTTRIGVDSARCGLFDDALYDERGEYLDGDFRDGVIPNGVISVSGYGNGRYFAFSHINHGQVDVVAVVFY